MEACYDSARNGSLPLNCPVCGVPLRFLKNDDSIGVFLERQLVIEVNRPRLLFD